MRREEGESAAQRVLAGVELPPWSVLPRPQLCQLAAAPCGELPTL